MALRFKDLPTIGDGRAEPAQKEPARPRIRPNGYALIARAAIRNRLIVILVILAFSAVSAGIGLGSAAFDPARPPQLVLDPAYEKAAEDIRTAFPGLEDEFTATVASEDEEAARTAAMRVVKEMRARPELFDGVVAPGLGRFYEDNAILYVETEEVQRIVDGLERRAPLFRALAAYPSLAGLAALAQQVQVSLAAGTSPEGLEAFLAAAAQTVAGEIEGKPRPLDWTSLLELSPRIAQRQWTVRAAALRPAALDTARSIAGEAAAAGIGVSIKLNGPALEREARTNQSIHGVRLAATLGLALAAITLATGLGSVRLGTALLLALLTLAGIAVSIPAYDGQGTDSLSMFYLPVVLLIGAEIFAAHALRAWEEEERGHGRRAAIVLSAHRAGLASTLIAVAAAAGFAWFWSGHLSMQAFALRVIAGAGTALVLAVTLVPALLSYGAPEEDTEEPGRHWLDALLDSSGNRFWRKFRAAAAAAGLVIGVAGLLVFVDFKLLADREQAGVAQILAAPAEAPDLVRRLSELREVGSTRTIETLLPPPQSANIAVLARLGGVYPERGADTGLRSFEDMRADFERLQVSLQIAGNAPNISPTLGAAANDLRRSLALFDAPLPANEDQLRRLEFSLFGGLDALLARIRLLSAPEPLTVARLDPDLKSRFIAADGRWRIEVRAAGGITPERFARALKDAAPQATGPAIAALAERASLAPPPQILALALLPLLAFLLAFRSLRHAFAAFAAFIATLAFLAGLVLVTGVPVRPSQFPVLLLFGYLACAIACRPALRAETLRFGAGTARRAALLAGAGMLMAGLPLLLAPNGELNDIGRMAALAASALIAAAVVLQPQIAYWLGLETWRFRRSG